MQLRRDPGCIHGLTWRLQPRCDVDLARLLRGVAAAGWKESPGIGELLIYAIPGGHRLLLVPSTGRVQIRLDYRLGVAQRPLAAQAIVASLTRWMDAAGPHPAPAQPRSVEQAQQEGQGENAQHGE